MNTVEELINHGFDKYTAASMLDVYSSKIGKMNGIYKITDITYDFSKRGRDVTLRCTSCGREIHRLMINGRNKWSELIKTCPCQAERRLKEQLSISKNLKIQKRSMIENRIGETYGDYTLISVDDIDSRNPGYVMKCNTCGFEKIVSANCFDRLDFKCNKHFKPIKYDDSYIGKKYNHLEIIGFEYKDKLHRMAKCKCDCGNTKLVVATNVINGTVKSCGCMSSKLLHDSFWKEDALNRQRLYRIWRGMGQRCYNRNNDNYSYYGGRGISVCDEWLNSYDIFKEWALSHGYSDDLSIDRIDVNGNYEPSNCRWADWKTQADNKRPKKRNIKWTIDGITKSAIDWCEEYGVSYEMVTYRIKHKEMSVYEALITPKITKGRNRKACSA